MKHFKGAFFVTVLGLILAYLWGEHVLVGSGFKCIFITFVLSVLEVSLSFDNAVVNAMKLETMSEKWQHRFITWGIAIAVFGMRFLFPLLVVSIFANINILKVLNIAINNSKLYAFYLHQTHAPIVTFGGAFLIMLFMGYFFNSKKELDWIVPIEKPLKQLPGTKIFDTLITLAIVDVVQMVQPSPIRMNVLLAGISGIIVFLLIDTISHKLENLEGKREKSCCNTKKALGCSCFISFMYLELIDASFSLDGVLGAFALSNDIIIITIGLAIGAMFVRSLTLLLVEEKTLTSYPYLEHGAHWAIGVLAILMFVSTVVEVPEVVTGLSGLVFIVGALISSIKKNRENV